MKIIPGPAPTGNPVTDTQNIQEEIDNLYNAKEQGRINLEAGKYKIGYFERTNADGTIDHIPTEQFDSRSDARGYRFVGLILKTIPLSELENGIQNNPFIEIRGVSNGLKKTVFEKYNLPDMVEIDRDILDYLNAHYFQIVAKTSGGVLEPAELSGELSEFLSAFNSTSDSATRSLIRKIYRHYKKNNEPNLARFTEKLIEEVDHIKHWNLTRAIFKFARMVNAVEGSGTPYEWYNNEHDSMYVKLNHLHFDGINHIEEEKGWFSDQYQFEQAHLLTVYARGDGDFDGKVCVTCSNSSFDNSIADGALAYSNSKLVLNHVKSSFCSRGSFSCTSTNVAFTARNVICKGNSKFRSTFGFEVDNVGANPALHVKLSNVNSRVIKLTLGDAHGRLTATNLNTSFGFNVSGHLSRFNISNSKFKIMPYYSKGGFPIHFYHPGQTNMHQCEFDVHTEVSESRIEDDAVQSLILITMQYNNFYRHSSGNKFVVVKKEEGDVSSVEELAIQQITGISEGQRIDTREKLRQFTRENQIVAFHDCTFKNDSHVTFPACFETIRNYIENENHAYITDCSISGSFLNVFRMASGRLTFSDLTVNITTVSNDYRNTLLRINDMDRSGGRPSDYPADAPYFFGTNSMGLVLSCTGEMDLKNIYHYADFVAYSDKATVNNMGVQVKAKNARLLFPSGGNSFTAIIIGGRQITGNSALQRNPNTDQLTGMKGDEFTPLYGDQQGWRCVQSGDFSGDRIAVWEPIRKKVKLNTSFDLGKLKKINWKKK